MLPTHTPRRGTSDLPESRRPRRRVPGLLLVLAVLFLVVGGFWLLMGLIDSAHAVEARAGSARSELEKFKAAVEQGNPQAANEHLAAARRHLADADAAAARRPVRVAGVLPVLGSAVSDLDHLLAAGHLLANAGGDVLVLQRDFRWDEPISVGGRVDGARLDEGSQAANRLTAALDGAGRELRRMHTGRLVPAALAKARAAGLRQVAELQGRVGALAAVTAAVPDALGARQPRTYVLAILGPGELRPSGGAPLGIAVLRANQGRLTVEEPGGAGSRGAASAAWLAQVADQVGRAATSADWPARAQELCQTFGAQLGTAPPDGVLALDTVAFAELLRVTGPVTAPTLGTLTAETLGQTLLTAAYARSVTPSPSATHPGLDPRVLGAVVTQLVDDGRMSKLGTVVGPAATRRHFRLYFRDSLLQGLVATQGLGGTPAAPDDDYLGVFAADRGGAPMTLVTRREIQHEVRLRADGGADVTRTVVLRNAAPTIDRASALRALARSPDLRQRILREIPVGVAAPLLLRTILVGYVPDDAAQVRLSGDATVRSDPLVVREPGLRAVAGSSQLRPGESATYRLTYTLPKDEAGGYTLSMDPQPVLTAPSLRVDVFAPPGRAFAPAQDWVVNGGHASWSGRLDRPRTLTLTPPR